MKKILCIILSLSVVIASFSVFTSIVSADVNRENFGTYYPTVYVGGQGQQINDANGNKLYPFDEDLTNEFLSEVASQLLPKYKDALFSQDWDEFLDTVYDLFSPIISKIALDENGDASDGSTNEWQWTKENYSIEKINGKYPVYRYYFNYDWRLDPFVTARKLHNYIEDILEITGEEKVELVGRCLGACVANAYLYLYDGEYIDSYVQYASAAQGSLTIEKLYSGQIGLDPDSIENYFSDNYLGLDENLNSFIVSVMTILNKTYGLDLICKAFDKTYSEIYMDILPRLMGETFATFPGYWSMVSDNDNCYNEAKRVLLYSRGYTDDSVLVKRIDDYHYNVQNKVGELFDRMTNEKNIHISNITKYGFCARPFLKNARDLGDDTCSVTASSNGATTSRVNTVLSPLYILKAKFNGTEKYISPDWKIDASTCLRPDSTWFIKDLKHPDFPDFIEAFLATILNDNDITVDSYDEYPQFLVYNKENESLDKMDNNNMFTDKRYYTSLTKAVANFFKYLPAVLAMLDKG